MSSRMDGWLLAALYARDLKHAKQALRFAMEAAPAEAASLQGALEAFERSDLILGCTLIRAARQALKEAA